MYVYITEEDLVVVRRSRDFKLNRVEIKLPQPPR